MRESRFVRIALLQRGVAMGNNPCGGIRLCERADLPKLQNAPTPSPNKPYCEVLAKGVMYNLHCSFFCCVCLVCGVGLERRASVVGLGIITGYHCNRAGVLGWTGILFVFWESRAERYREGFPKKPYHKLYGMRCLWRWAQPHRERTLGTKTCYYKANAGLSLVWRTSTAWRGT